MKRMLSDLWERAFVRSAFYGVLILTLAWWLSPQTSPSTDASEDHVVEIHYMAPGGPIRDAVEDAVREFEFLSRRRHKETNGATPIYRVIAGQHASENQTEITKTQQHAERAVSVELQPNHCSLHDAKLIHGSEPNTSSLRRCGWTLRFMPAHVELNEQDVDTHMIYQARGRNLAGQRLADPTVDYTEAIGEARHQGKTRRFH